MTDKIAQKGELRAKNIKIKHVHEFPYLGNVLTDGDKCNTETRCCIRLAKEMNVRKC